MVPDLETIKNRFIERHRDMKHYGERAAAGAVNQLVVIGATLFIGVFVLANIGDAMPADHMFSDPMTQVESVLGSSIELAAILPIVIIAAGLLFYVRNFSDGAGGRR